MKTRPKKEIIEVLLYKHNMKLTDVANILKMSPQNLRYWVSKYDINLKKR